jgi:hypothetical protein
VRFCVFLTVVSVNMYFQLEMSVRTQTVTLVDVTLHWPKP